MPFYNSGGRGKKIHEWLTVEEIELLIRAADNARDQVLITFGYFSGLRVAEISNTQVKDIDWKEGTLKVRQGKGSKDRIVAVHPVLKGILEKWLRSVIDDPEAYLFPGTIRDQGMTTRQIHRIVSDTAKRAGIKKRVHPHTLRHSIATHLYKDCKDIVVVSNFLGHSSVSTTQIYADADIDDQILAMAKL